MIDLRMMLRLLVVLSPKEFYIELGSINALFGNKEIEVGQIFDEVLFLLKEFFIQRNLDGKSLFRVLIKEKMKGQEIQEEILWKIFELIFTVGYMIRSHDIFDLALIHAKKENGLFEEEVKEYEVNSMLTKSVI